jgi:PucR C-terminal helix-turn-helix domain/GGDEF-like domain
MALELQTDNHKAATGSDTQAGLATDLALLASVLAGRRDELAEAMTDQIMSQAPIHEAHPAREALVRTCRAHLDALLGLPYVPPHQRAEAARRVAADQGRTGAEQGMPLVPLLDSYRVGLRVLWEAVLRAGPGADRLDRDQLGRAASAMWSLHDIWVQGMTDAYQKAAHEKVLARECERSAMAGMVLDGHIQDPQDLWDIVEALRLPHDGPYVVVAAEVLETGEQERIRLVENRLSRAGVPSAWRLQPDGHPAVTGIAAVRGTARLEALTEVLSAAWPHRAGISPRFRALGGARRALRFATLAMAGAPRGSADVTVFDRAPVAVLAASAPDVMAEVAEVVLGSLNRLPDEERAVLVGTLRTWLTCGGSVDAAAKTLFCHPNTVRYRLNRVTEHTGRSLTDPQAVTELTLALQADHLTRAA